MHLHSNTGRFILLPLNFDNLPVNTEPQLYIITAARDCQLTGTLIRTEYHLEPFFIGPCRNHSLLVFYCIRCARYVCECAAFTFVGCITYKLVGLQRP